MKQKEVKELSIDELNEKLVSFQKELSDLKMTHAISPIENPMQIKNPMQINKRPLTSNQTNRNPT